MAVNKKRWIAAIVTVVYCYAVGAFVSLEPNPLNWEEVSRGLFGIVVPWFALMAALCPIWEWE